MKIIVTGPPNFLVTRSINFRNFTLQPSIANRLDPPEEKGNHENELDPSLGLHGDNSVLTSANEDDEPPPRPPPPLEDIELPRHVANSNQTKIDFNGQFVLYLKSQKDLFSDL